MTDLATPPEVAAAAERRRWWTVLAGLVGVLVVANVMSNRVLPKYLYVPWNVAVAAVVVLIAGRLVTREEMGFTRWRRGLAWGLVVAGLTLGVLLLAAAIPALRDVYQDRRVGDGITTWSYHAVVRIPLGTALMEEVAFRGALLAVLARRAGIRRASLWSSLLFGLWHVLPAMGLDEVNPVFTDLFGTGTAGELTAVALAVVGTLLAGLWFCWLRIRSGSLLAPLIAHAASNSLAYTVAWSIA